MGSAWATILTTAAPSHMPMNSEWRKHKRRNVNNIGLRYAKALPPLVLEWRTSEVMLVKLETLAKSSVSVRDVGGSHCDQDDTTGGLGGHGRQAQFTLLVHSSH